ncbi:MAG: aminoglycoside 6-adenylyltransferase [Anaerolineae bacterium]|nr:aminoglycoside 6-adenylyltransferase [Anaerolineae bacterium]
MYPRYADTIERICVWSQQTEEIKGTIIIGSQARDISRADQWSDLDLMVLVQTPDLFLKKNQWLGRFGNVVCAYNHITPLYSSSWDWCVKRVLFDDNRDIDFSILPYEHLDEIVAINQTIMLKGHQVIYDAHAPLLESSFGALKTADQDSAATLPTEDEWRNTINDLLYHIIWAFKKIKRQELWVAVSDINQHISSLLLRLIEWHTESITHQPTTIAYHGRFLEMRATGEVISRLRHCFTTYDSENAIETLGHLIDFTLFISQELHESSGYELNTDQFAMIRNLYRGMKEHVP